MHFRVLFITLIGSVVFAEGFLSAIRDTVNRTANIIDKIRSPTSTTRRPSFNPISVAGPLMTSERPGFRNQNPSISSYPVTEDPFRNTNDVIAAATGNKLRNIDELIAYMDGRLNLDMSAQELITSGLVKFFGPILESLKPLKEMQDRIDKIYLEDQRKNPYGSSWYSAISKLANYVSTAAKVYANTNLFENVTSQTASNGVKLVIELLNRSDFTSRGTRMNDVTIKGTNNVMLQNGRLSALSSDLTGSVYFTHSDTKTEVEFDLTLKELKVVYDRLVTDRETLPGKLSIDINANARVYLSLGGHAICYPQVTRVLLNAPRNAQMLRDYKVDCPTCESAPSGRTCQDCRSITQQVPNNFGISFKPIAEFTLEEAVESVIEKYQKDVCERFRGIK